MSEKGRIVVIGSGAAGSAAARSLAGAGWSVTVAEEGKAGGTCLWHGCMPKKALYTSAKAARAVRNAEQFGVVCAEPAVDWQGVLAWKWHAQETYAGDQEGILADRGVALVRGSAVFTSPSSVAIGDETLGFDHAVIATGSVPVLPPVDGVELADTSDDALGYATPPESIVIVGGGYIAFEFAGIFASFGTQVTIVVSSAPLKDSDPDAVAVAVRHLERLGVTFVRGYRLDSVAGEPGSLVVRLRDASGDVLEESAERVLLATGRRAALDSLDLELGEIATDERGRLQLDDGLRTSNPRVWAAGDAAGGLMQTPVASYEGRVVATSIDSGSLVVPEVASVPTTVFTIPQIAQVGLTEVQAQEQGVPYRVGMVDFEFLGAAIIDDDRDGLVKLLFAEGDGSLIGAHVAGPTASDLIYGLALGVRTGATADDMRATLGIHPGYAESLNWASM
jgi:pyruvate/2-oxoglutarate dehydrogenase complex dihydrolipoamide dehydrogenase (E3) component